MAQGENKSEKRVSVHGEMSIWRKKGKIQESEENITGNQEFYLDVLIDVQSINKLAVLSSWSISDLLFWLFPNSQRRSSELVWG